MEVFPADPGQGGHRHLAAGLHRRQAGVDVAGVVREDLLESWQAKIPLGTPNHFAINIQPDEVEAFKAGEISALREFNAEKWATQYEFPAIARGEVVKSEFPHGKPSGMTGFVMNTRSAPMRRRLVAASG